ncbi:MAG TPA: pyruvate dehydrogenase (acetyl-transferring), homodimeric type [Oligoflexia bacterium]|nr:pyruvate dehydrogenase (acetyl-transferring), homodimeric type [Oligoflexia bacterium]
MAQEMKNPYLNNDSDDLALDKQEWRQSLDAISKILGPEKAKEVVKDLLDHAAKIKVSPDNIAQTPYINTIHATNEKSYPGDLALEEKILKLIRWNAMVMVVRANRLDSSIGGHIATYASSAHLYETGFHHFFRGKSANENSDQIYIQGHASPGIYARSYLEGRFNEQQLINFRRELQTGGGLSSYPHPRSMPDYWEFPTVSMGLGPITAIYQARMAQYLTHRGLKPENTSQVWAFLGDGEMDEPESLGAIHIAQKEKLHNLNFVINCNLQRLDGPVRGNGKVIQDLEGQFRGAGWNVIKVLWSSDWDSIFAQDTQGLLEQKLTGLLDGNMQKLATLDGAQKRQYLCQDNPDLLKLFAHLSDDQMYALKRGGHDPIKVYNAYAQAQAATNAPTVILAQTIKGYGLGPSGHAANATHQKKKLSDAEVLEFRDRFEIPVSDQDAKDLNFYRPDEKSPEMQYLLEKRKNLGGFLPSRNTAKVAVSKSGSLPDKKVYQEFYDGTKDREVSTTMAFVKLLTNLIKDKTIGKQVIPIVPDEARTFGMESMFSQIGIYSPHGQNYEPVDKKSLLYYKESKTGQLLEEGITEAGSMASFIAAGNAAQNHGVACIPFFIYYSMFGMQRIGDLVWAAADQNTKGFMMGGTAGRTTLAGEGLQHQDGHSILLAYPVPNLKVYDPAFAYETAIIVEDGLQRMYENNEDIFYYITLENENYAMPPMPKGVKEGILKGMYRYSPSKIDAQKPIVHLMGSGSILNETLKAQNILEEKYKVATEVWSVTSYKELYTDAVACEEWNTFNPNKPKKQAFVTAQFKDQQGICVAASDYVKALPHSISNWLPLPLTALGTDGFGLSENREYLRKHFKVDAQSIVYASLSSLSSKGLFDQKKLEQL